MGRRRTDLCECTCVLKRDITAGDALKHTLQRFLPLLGSALLWTLVVFGLFITIIGIPFSIYFGVRWDSIAFCAV